MITVSEEAKTQVLKILEETKSPESMLRVGVKGGGCGGLSYTLDFDTEVNDGDEIFEDKGIKIICDMKSLLYIWGTELVYSGGLNGKGFEFSNPSASRTCSCGSSFSV